MNSYMDYVQLGSTGVRIAPIILGTMQFGWRVDKEASFEIMDRALEMGINCFDTADIYSKWAENSYAGKSEEIIGEWMQDRGNRDDIILATKLRQPMSSKVNDQGLSRRHVRRSISGSLKRLQTDWIDLYQIHSFDQTTPITETLHALSMLVDEGKVNYLGSSNIFPWQFVESLWAADTNGYHRFETLQPVYNLARRLEIEYQYTQIFKRYNVGVIPYSPLGGGFFTGKYKKDQTLPETPRSKGVQSRYFKDRRWDILNTVEEIATSLQVTVAQVALAWVLAQPFVTAPIIGANSIQQLEENLGALDVVLSQDDLKRLDGVSHWKSQYQEIR